MVLIGVGAVMAAVAWVIVLPRRRRSTLDSAAQDTAATGSLTTLAGPQNAVPAVADAAGRSVVELQATTSHAPPCVGVAVAEGGPGGHHRRPPVRRRPSRHGRPGGRSEPASVVATDTTSDVALVDVPDDLPVAPFADDTNLDNGTPDLTLSFVPAGGACRSRCAARPVR